MPAGQGVHDAPAKPGSVLNVPAAQGTQAELAAAPSTGCRFPAGHASQVLDEVAAVAVLKVPAAHGVHVSADVAAIGWKTYRRGRRRTRFRGCGAECNAVDAGRARFTRDGVFCADCVGKFA